MAFYSVVLHGQGIRLPAEDQSGDIVGFYATRFVRASTVEAACEVAKGMITADWTREPYSSANRGSAPRLAVDRVLEVTFWQWLLSKNGGHVFYPDEEAPSEA